jgi:DNA-binding Xre family transcriptional regulator
MAIHPGVGPAYAALASVRLETPRVVRVVFDDGADAKFSVTSLPFSTGTAASNVVLVADGDLAEFQAPTGDFVVTADEFRGLLTDSLGVNADLERRVGENLRKTRADLGLSLKDAEALTGIAAPNLHNLESGRNATRLDTLTRLADAYRTTVAKLVSTDLV